MGLKKKEKKCSNVCDYYHCSCPLDDSFVQCVKLQVGLKHNVKPNPEFSLLCVNRFKPLRFVPEVSHLTRSAARLSFYAADDEGFTCVGNLDVSSG